jgi:sarcosine oxidase, subunit beta
MHPDIVILGAGVIGASVAYHLARRGVRNIVVLDRADDFGGGSTAKATGGFRAQFETEAEVRLSMRSREKLLAFPEEIGRDSGYRPTGYLFLACNEDELALMRNAQAVQHACGLAEARMLGAEEARAINPAIGDATVIGGAFCPTDGFIRPMSILRGYAEAAMRLGVRFEFGVSHRGFLLDGDRVLAAQTSKGDVRAGAFVNAMGAWAGAPVVPVRRNIAATVATSVLHESMPMTVWAGDWYHVRVRDGRVLLVWPDDPPYEHWLAWVLRLTHERLPCLTSVAIDECWSGFYEMTPDGRALLGPTLENLFLATGCSGHGVMHAPAIGEVVAEMIVDGRTSIDVSALDPHRNAAQWSAGVSPAGSAPSRRR